MLIGTVYEIGNLRSLAQNRRVGASKEIQSVVFISFDKKDREIEESRGEDGPFKPRERNHVT